MKALCLLFVWLLSFHLLAGQINEGDSPSGKIHFEVRDGITKDGPKEIWLSPKGHKENAVMLSDTEGWGNLVIHFSPDDFWIIVQDGGASLGVHLTLFRRVKGVTYTDMKNDIGDKAVEFAAKQNGWPADYRIDHLYSSVLDWSGDSKYVLVSISGQGSDGKHGYSIDDWKAFYNLGTSLFSFDLNKVNAGSVEKVSLK